MSYTQEGWVPCEECGGRHAVFRTQWSTDFMYLCGIGGWFVVSWNSIPDYAPGWTGEAWRERLSQLRAYRQRYGDLPPTPTV